MKKLIVILTLILSAMTAYAQADHYVSPTKYDWSGLATSITAGKTTNYDKFYAIYRWLCDNIAYDTSYSIHTADECYEKQRGVCQAYSEMFYRLAESLGLKAVMVSGFSKSQGFVSPDGHCWIFAYTDPAKGTGILIDPTWGAGSVKGNVFTHHPGDDSWFHVNPAWMIFTHYPTDAAYQLLGDRTVSRETFDRLPDHHPALSKFGFNCDDILKSELAGNHLTLPECYETAMLEFGVERAQIPTSRYLTVGTPVNIALKTRQPVENVIMVGDACGPYFNKGEWQRQGDYLYCRFMPARQGDVIIGVLNNEGTYSAIATYEASKPSAADIQRLEAAQPELSPVWDKFKDCRPEIMMDKGVHLPSMLDTIRTKGVTVLPSFYPTMDFKVREVPYDGLLRVGKTYDFEFIPPRGAECAIIVGSGSDNDWYKDWYTDDRTGILRLSVTPKKEGQLKLTINGTDGLFYSCVEYKVRY